ncbi:uncharacterized protein PSANT_02602 [Moesziomyces antarcticus]|uniref:Uncharacterized protein n=1 Tax=Pseudozyma antarctica TaxID=84753 RepID=A0A5C3FL41_PSEA2|nr:uncharacterized protein PSANT_02602 [Moesziomyces antarcticus]
MGEKCFTPKASGDDDDRGSYSFRSEAYDDEESMPESDWYPRDAAALRHEAEVRAFAPPPDPIFYLGNTRISSADYACPRQLRKTALSHAEPRPLNLVVRIVENKPSKKNGTSQYRLMKVDLGDGVMDMLANVGSDLYNVDKKHNAFPIDAIVILEDVRGVFRGKALALDFWPFSCISRCDDELGVTWDQVQARNQNMTMLSLRGRLPADVRRKPLSSGHAVQAAKEAGNRLSCLVVGVTRSRSRSDG